MTGCINANLDPVTDDVDYTGVLSLSSVQHFKTDISLESNVVQLVLSCNDFPLIFLTPILQIMDCLLPECSVVVKVDLGVHAEYCDEVKGRFTPSSTILFAGHLQPSS